MIINNLNVSKSILTTALVGGIVTATLVGCGKAEAKVPADDKQLYAVIFGDDTATILKPIMVDFGGDDAEITLADGITIVSSASRTLMSNESYDKIDDLIYAVKGRDVTINEFVYYPDEKNDSEHFYALVTGEDTTTLIECGDGAAYLNNTVDLRLKNGDRIIMPFDDVILSSLPEEDNLRLSKLINGDKNIIYYQEDQIQKTK